MELRIHLAQDLEKLKKEIKWEVESPWTQPLPPAKSKSQQIRNSGSSL